MGLPGADDGGGGVWRMLYSSKHCWFHFKVVEYYTPLCINLATAKRGWGLYTFLELPICCCWGHKSWRALYNLSLELVWKQEEKCCLQMEGLKKHQKTKTQRGISLTFTAILESVWYWETNYEVQNLPKWDLPWTVDPDSNIICQYTGLTTTTTQNSMPHKP